MDKVIECVAHFSRHEGDDAKSKEFIEFFNGFVMEIIDYDSLEIFASRGRLQSD